MAAAVRRWPWRMLSSRLPTIPAIVGGRVGRVKAALISLRPVVHASLGSDAGAMVARRQGDRGTDPSPTSPGD
jgi:hypothetical protein